MAGNFAVLGESKDETETIGDVIKRAARPDVVGPTFEANHSSVQAPVCAVHHRSMVLMRGRRGPFWSCHQKNGDGSWCDFKPE
jgi:hypothetical protein